MMSGMNTEQKTHIAEDEDEDLGERERPPSMPEICADIAAWKARAPLRSDPLMLLDLR
jgi:hypothetical protein